MSGTQGYLHWEDVADIQPHRFLGGPPFIVCPSGKSKSLGSFNISLVSAVLFRKKVVSMTSENHLEKMEPYNQNTVAPITSSEKKEGKKKPSTFLAFEA